MDNSVDQSLFNEKSLYLLNIKELRVLGRKFGVPSPTSKSKKELVEYILNVVYGKVTIPVRNLYGRRPKNSKQFNMEKFLDKVKTNSDIADKYEYSSSMEFNQFKVASPSETYELDDFNLITKIYCYENERHYLKSMAFVKSENDIELSSEFVNNFGLENFDVVELIVIDDLIKLVSINGVKCKDKFSDMEIAGIPIFAGFNNEFYFDSENELLEETNKMLLKFEKNGIKPLIFTKNHYQNKNLQSVEYSEDEDSTQIYKKIMYFSNLCEASIKNGEDIAVIIENFNEICDIFAAFDLNINAKITKYISEICDKISRLGNITLFFNLEEKDDIKY